MKKITIFSSCFYKGAKRERKSRFFRFFLKNKTHGPEVVFRSIKSGLRKLKADFNYDPEFEEDIRDIVYVPGGVKPLINAIEKKEKGLIKKIIAGPNIVSAGSDFNHILSNKNIDLYLVPSEWFKNALEKDDPRLIGKIKILPTGVDLDIWNCDKISDNKLKRKVIVYQKNGSLELFNSVCSILKKNNFVPIKIKYGSFDHRELKKKLSKSLFSVFLTKRETQGIAFLESWAMDLPTFVWDSEPMADNGTCSASPCPHLSDRTGKFWKNLDEFEKLIKNYKNNLYNFTPRAWVLENMTDEVCAKKFLEIVDKI